MRNSKTAMLGAMLALGLSSAVHSAPVTSFNEYPSWIPFKGKKKPKRCKANPLRGYERRHTHLLSIYDTDQNLAKMANGKSGFKGFRKVRKFNELLGMTVWSAP